jgi:hypothetical protein
VSRVGVWEDMSGGSVLGFFRVVMIVCVRVWGVSLRLMSIGTMSTSVPGKCERSAFAKGVYFSMMRWWVSLKLSSVQYFHMHSPI